MVSNLELCPSKIKHRELLKYADEMVDLYLNKNKTLREIGVLFDTDKSTQYDDSIISCVTCKQDITHHKLGRLFCDQCRPRDCSYLKYMKTLLEQCDFSCTYCHTKISRRVPPTIDHIVPLSRGGTNDLQNLTIACRSCNARKGTKSFSEFQKEVILW
mgnify:FL=1